MPSMRQFYWKLVSLLQEHMKSSSLLPQVGLRALRAEQLQCAYRVSRV